MATEELLKSLIDANGRLRTETAGSDRSTKYQFIFHQHLYLNNASRFADLKAAALAGVSGTLLGLLVREYAALSGNTLSLLSFALGSGILFTGIVLALLVVYPRRRARHQKSFMYWEGVRAHQEDEFVQALMRTNTTQLLEHLMRHNYVLAGIVAKKYSTLNQAFLVSVLGYLFLALAFLSSHWF